MEKGTTQNPHGAVGRAAGKVTGGGGESSAGSKGRCCYFSRPCRAFPSRELIRRSRQCDRRKWVGARGNVLRLERG